MTDSGWQTFRLFQHLINAHLVPLPQKVVHQVSSDTGWFVQGPRRTRAVAMRKGVAVFTVGAALRSA